MFKGIANLAALLKQAQQMGGRMQSLADELKGRRVQGAAGGGLVEVEVNGLAEVLRVKIDTTLIEQSDRELLEDMVAAAVNQALAKARQLHAESVKSLTGDIDMPGLEQALSSLTGGGSQSP